VTSGFVLSKGGLLATANTTLTARIDLDLEHDPDPDREHDREHDRGVEDRPRPRPRGSTSTNVAKHPRAGCAVTSDAARGALLARQRSDGFA
jgi:hypothetical protein